MSRIVDKLGRPNGPYYHGLLSQPDCAACPLRMDTKVLPDGPVPARIAFVGEGPGAKEEGVGKGWVGPSGQLLWQLAQQTEQVLKQQYGVDLRLRREDVWCSNSGLCRPRKIILENKAVISMETVKSDSTACCRLRLINELRIVDPVVIVPFGSWSLWSVGDMVKSKVYAYRGSRIEVELDQLAQNIVEGKTRVPYKKPRT